MRMAALTVESAAAASMRTWARWGRELDAMFQVLTPEEQSILATNLELNEEASEVLAATEEQHRLIYTSSGKKLVELLRRVREGTQYHIDLAKQMARRLRKNKPARPTYRAPKKRRGKNTHMGLKRKGKRK
jgi:hypothetical protein